MVAGSALHATHATAQGQPAAEATTAPERARRVLILNDADPTLPAFVAMDRAMRAALTAPGRPRVDIFFEALDTLRFPGTQLQNELVALLAKKYVSLRIDVVVAIGTASLDFAELHRDRLWPDARIVFSGVPMELLRDRQLAPTTTGMLRRFDLDGTVGLALALRPATRRLVVIAGSGDFDKLMTGLARTQLEPYAKRLTLDYWVDAPIDHFLLRVAQLDSNDAVLYLSIGRDSAGQTFVPREVLKRLSVASPAPIYGAVETYLGHGAVAVSAYSIEGRGRRMGELVHEVLSSPPGHPLPPVAVGTAACIADANELQRFGISERRLPAGCEIRFARPSLWHEYHWYVVGTLVALLAQSALILALVLQRRGRRKAEHDARDRRSELAQASRLALAGELTASIAHEINQPLGAILANTSAAEAMLRHGVTDTDELRAILADIRTSDQRASEIIRRVRSLVTTRQSRHEPADVNTIVSEVLAMVQGEAGRRGVIVEPRLGSSLPAILADRVQLQQALVNLCVNAMDAMDDIAPEKRRLGVRTMAMPGGGEIEIAVSDSGPGIAPEQLPRLFDSFFTTKAHGMGLGLSITRSIVEAHGGTLSGRNRADGGALFWMMLPAHDPDAPAPNRPSTQGAQPPAPAAADSQRL
jgi:signal transduction histidine kinase